MDDCYLTCAIGPYGHAYPQPPNRKAQIVQGYIDKFCIDHGKCTIKRVMLGTIVIRVTTVTTRYRCDECGVAFLEE